MKQAGDHRVAVFDVDGTLLRGDCLWIAARRAKGPVGQLLAVLACLPWLIAWQLRLVSTGRFKQQTIAAFGVCEAVNLADHGVTGDAIAKTAGDLAGAQPFRPELLEKLDALICPGQFVSPSKIDFMLCSQTESLKRRRTRSVPACSFTKLTVRRYIS